MTSLRTPSPVVLSAHEELEGEEGATPMDQDGAPPGSSEQQQQDGEAASEAASKQQQQAPPKKVGRCVVSGGHSEGMSLTTVGVVVGLGGMLPAGDDPGGDGLRGGRRVGYPQHRPARGTTNQQAEGQAGGRQPARTRGGA